jgi:hypothetical protein
MAGLIGVDADGKILGNPHPPRLDVESMLF